MLHSSMECIFYIISIANSTVPKPAIFEGAELQEAACEALQFLDELTLPGCLHQRHQVPGEHRARGVVLLPVALHSGMARTIRSMV